MIAAITKETVKTEDHEIDLSHKRNLIIFPLCHLDIQPLKEAAEIFCFL